MDQSDADNPYDGFVSNRGVEESKATEVMPVLIMNYITTGAAHVVAVGGPV